MLNLIINRTSNSNINADGSTIYFASCEINFGDRVVAMITLQESSSEVLEEALQQLNDTLAAATLAGGFRLVFLKDPGGVRDKSFTPYWSEKVFLIQEKMTGVNHDSCPTITGTNNVFDNREVVLLQK